MAGVGGAVRERVGRRGSGRVGYAVVIPGCETTGRCRTEVPFFHIHTTFWGSFASVSGGVGSCGGWRILGQSYTTCSAVSFPTSHFL